MPVPGAWQDAYSGETVDLVPLVDGDDPGAGPGWCTYPWGFESPEVEVFCGGQNSKTPDAAAVWRQGFLVHFGFEQGPAQLNDAGRTLLVNVIAYAARCAGDRPITRVVSPFRDGKRALMPREKAARHLGDAEALAVWFVGPVLAELAGLPADERTGRFRELEPFLRGGAENRFEVDPELRAWGVANRDVAMLVRCFDEVRRGGEGAVVARRVLARYVPDGPGNEASDDGWAKWLAKHRDFMFFSDVGGFRWYVDPLALARGVPTAELRGSARIAPRRG